MFPVLHHVNVYIHAYAQTHYCWLTPTPSSTSLMFAKSFLLWVTFTYLYTLCTAVDISVCARGGIGAVAMTYVVLFSCFPLYSLFGYSGTRPGQKLGESIVFKIDASLWKEVENPGDSLWWQCMKKEYCIFLANLFHTDIRKLRERSAFPSTGSCATICCPCFCPSKTQWDLNLRKSSSTTIPIIFFQKWTKPKINLVLWC